MPTDLFGVVSTRKGGGDWYSRRTVAIICELRFQYRSHSFLPFHSCCCFCPFPPFWHSRRRTRCLPCSWRRLWSSARRPSAFASTTCSASFSTGALSPTTRLMRWLPSSAALSTTFVRNTACGGRACFVSKQEGGVHVLTPSFLHVLPRVPRHGRRNGQ